MSECVCVFNVETDFSLLAAISIYRKPYYGIGYTFLMVHICTLRVNGGQTHCSPVTHEDVTDTWSETIISAIMRSRRKHVDEVQTIHNISSIMIVSVLPSTHTKKNGCFLSLHFKTASSSVFAVTSSGQERGRQGREFFLPQ